MTCKLTGKNRALRVASSCVTILTILAALMTLAQEPVPSNRTRTRPQGIPALNQGNTVSFLPPLFYDSGGGAVSTAIADVNGDGKADLLVANYNSGTVGVLLGNGDGTFQPPVTYDCGGPDNPYSIAVGDFNGDGKPDIALVVVVNGSRPALRVLQGNGDGTFQAPVAYETGGFNPYQIVVADVNGDSKLDLVIANEFVVSVLLGNGDGTFQTAVTYGIQGFANSVAVGDVNGDGKPDLIVANGTVAVLLGRGDGTFLPAVDYSTGAGSSWSVAIADVNGDGKPDLVVGHNNHPNEDVVGVLLGNGDGTFQPTVTYPSGGVASWKVAVADVNGDGRPDVVVANRYSESVAVLVGNGDGTFQTPVTYASGGDPWALLATDLSGDGKPDLVVADLSFSCNCSNPGGLALLLSGTGPRRPTTTTVTPSANPVAPNQTVTYTATVKRKTGGQATGTVTLSDRSRAIAVVGLVGNRASWTTEYAKIGGHVITATYPGDAKTAGSTSAAFTEHIAVLPVSSTTRVASSGSPSLLGHPVTFTANVTSYYGTIPDGELVTFYDGTTTLASVPLMSGRAAYTTSSLSATTHVIKATYAGSATFLPSFGRVVQVVNKYPTTTTLHSTLNPSHIGQAVTFTARVTSPGPTPTGTVKFLDGATGIGQVTLSGGLAKLTKSNLSVGTHPITAQYLGDSASAKSTSSVLNQVVK